MKRDWSQYNEEIVKRGDKTQNFVLDPAECRSKTYSICGGMVNDGLQKAISQQ